MELQSLMPSVTVQRPNGILEQDSVGWTLAY